MGQEILEYIKTQRVGVLAVEMLDGSPHGATVHYAHSDDPFVIYFETNRDYRKAEPLYGREKTRATFVVGTNEEDKKTLQLDGIAELLSPTERETFDLIYLKKFPEKMKKFEDPTFVFFKFTPTWWRFTDWKAADGKKILVSTD